MGNVIDTLHERGFIEAITSDELRNLTENPLRIYCGFDPTSDSLHLGNMVAIMGLAWFQRFGHTPVAIVGGATGMIGDPSGKAKERQLLDEQTLQRNLIGITKNLEAILDCNAINAPIILNNYDWFKEFSFIDFLRDVGKHFRIGTMLAKDSVKARFETEEGMSFTEFSYQLLQSYDFLYLNKEYGVVAQLGGSDQWGNITAGTDLVRKVLGKSVHGITFPLLTKSDGQKFGKSEKGAIWLSPEKLSPYEFYQHLFRVADDDVIKLMKMLTFMEMDEIRHYEAMMLAPGYTPNTAQKKLAEEVTRIVHGEEGLDRALKATQAAAPGTMTELSAENLTQIASDLPSKEFEIEAIVNQKLVDVIVEAGMQPSKGATRRLIQSGGVYLNNNSILDVNFSISKSDLIDGKLLLIAIGKKNKMLIQIKEGSVDPAAQSVDFQSKS